jgi:cholesterol oxidase
MTKISRRDFIRFGAVGAVGLGGLGWSTKSWAAKSEFTEALIVGSGFGGSIAALRLAQAGIRSVVLERGRRWPIQRDGNTFATFENPDGRAAWLSDFTTSIDDPPIPIARYTGVLELINANGVVVRNGAGVGGGSLAYNGIMLQPRRRLFEQVFPKEIAYDEMNDVYYPRVRRMLGQSPIPTDILNSPYYASARVSLEQAQNARLFKGSLVEYAIDWDIVGKEIKTLEHHLAPGDADYRRPSAIDGQSWYGLNSGAKRSVDHNYLPQAEATGRVQVLPLHVVTDISESRHERLYFVSVNEIDTSGATRRQRVFACKHLFLAAGATGTPPLLVRAREKGTLPKLNKWVGQFWGSNGDFIVLRGGLDPNNHPGQGGPCGHILMEDLRKPGPSGLVELVVPKPQAQFLPGFSLYVGLGLAPAVGSFSYDPATDTVTLNWPHQDPRLDEVSNGANRMVNTLNAANPGTFNAFFSEDPAYRASGGPALTAHPVGGAVIGKACDQSGRVKHHHGLYVVDGSLVPGGSVGGVNPSFTIAALAERSMDRIIKKHVFDNRPHWEDEDEDEFALAQ